MTDLKVGVGSSRDRDSNKAGRKAALDAMAVFGENSRPDIAFLFASKHLDYERLLEGIHGVVGDIPMVGGTTAGEISTKGFATDSVVICLLGAKTLQFVSAGVRGMGSDEEKCGQDLANAVLEYNVGKDAKSLLLFPDGLGGDGVALIKGIQTILGAELEMAGGFLGDDGLFKETFQFYNGKCYRGDLVTAVLISGNPQYVTSTGVASGFESIGAKIYCTKADKNIVREFDGVRALDLYKDLLGEERSRRLPEVCLEYPFGLIDSKAAIGEYEYFQLRAGLQVDEQEGTIALAGAIPEGSAFTLTTASRAGIIDGAKQAAEQAKSGLSGARPRLIMMFSCIGRKIVLGRRTQEEIDIVKKVFGDDIPIVGFYTYGEIGPIDKGKKELCAARLHNETVVLWVLGEK